MSVGEVVKIKIRDLYESRNILRSLISKGLFGKYTNSHIGVFWHFLSPIIYIILCFILYTEVKGKTLDNFWLFVASGIFAFHMLNSSVSGGCNCFTNNSGLIKKIYFPKEILTISRSTVNLIICVIGYAVVSIVSIILGHTSIVALILMFPMYILMFIFSIGFMLILSTIAVYVRDLAYALSTMHIIFFICSPLRYSVYDTEGVLNTILWMNPFTYYIEVFHSILYYNEMPNPMMILYCSIISCIVMSFGMIVFHCLRKGLVKRL